MICEGQGSQEDVSGTWRALRKGSRGPRISDSLLSNLAAFTTEDFVTNGETKARRGQLTSLKGEFTGCLPKGVLCMSAVCPSHVSTSGP